MYRYKRTSVEIGKVVGDFTINKEVENKKYSCVCKYGVEVIKTVLQLAQYKRYPLKCACEQCSSDRRNKLNYDAFEECIMRALATPQHFHNLYKLILDDWGSVSERRLWSRLEHMKKYNDVTVLGTAYNYRLWTIVGSYWHTTGFNPDPPNVLRGEYQEIWKALDKYSSAFRKQELEKLKQK